MTVSARNVMSRRVVSAKPDDTVATAARLMAENDIGALPVCDDHGAPVGMISEGDLLLPFGRQQGFRRSWWLHLLADGERPMHALLDYLKSDPRHVRDLMTTPAVTVTPEASIDAIATLLTQHRIKRVPVVQNGRMIGIVSRANIIHAYSQRSYAPTEEWAPRRRGGNNPLG